MVISLEIIPTSRSVDIYGSAQSGLSTSYSLSGHILLSLSPGAAFFDHRAGSSRVTLTSLEVIFEGKAESIAGQCYAGARVCHVAKQLLPDGAPFELEYNGYNPEPASWQAVFDLALPGWLPASTVCGEDDMSGVSYTLIARATYNIQQEDNPPASISWRKLASVLCSAVLPRDRTARTQLAVSVNRYPARTPATSEFAVKLNVADPSASAGHPAEALANMQALITLPSHALTTDDQVPMSLALRFTGSESLAERLSIASVRLDIEQHERTHRSAKGFAGSFPLPAEADQPPVRPLLDAHPLQGLLPLSLICGSSSGQPESSRTWSVVPENQLRVFRFCDDGSASGGLTFQGDSWHKVSMKLPVKPASAASCSMDTFFDEDDDLTPGASFRLGKNTGDDRLPLLPTGKARQLLRPSLESPFYTVSHDVRVTITCRLNNGDAVNEVNVSFALPLRFACPAPATFPVAPSGYSPASHHLTIGPHCSYPRTHPLGTNALPAYSQLFHSNGDWRDEIHAGLPAYSKEDDVLVDVSTA